MSPHSASTSSTGSNASAGGPVSFPPTLWTLVIEANQETPERAEKALGELCVHYREAILTYFQMKCRHPHDAEDLTGAFIAHLLERRRLGSFNRQTCPRFRAYLSVALRNFFADWLARRNSEKRGGGQAEASIELLREEGVEAATDDPQLLRAVDVGMARAIHQRVLAILGQQAVDPERFAVLREFIPFEQGQENHEQASKRLGLSSAALRKAVFDLRRRYVQEFRAAVSTTVHNVRQDLEEETRALLAVLPEAVVREEKGP